MYSNEEIDFIFCLLTLIIFDTHYNVIFGLNPDISILFSCLFDAYNSELIEESVNGLSSTLLNMVEDQVNKNRDKLCNIYHKIQYLISFFPNDSLSLRLFKRKLANGCIFLLFNNFNEKKNSVSTNIIDLINELKINCQNIFSKSSYLMYNLIEFLNIILDDLSSNIDKNKQNLIIVENIKIIVSDANRMVREAMELQGRAQVNIYLLLIIKS